MRFVTVDVAYSTVSIAAKIKYAYSKKDREIVKNNLRTIIPGADRKEISLVAKEVFINFGKYLVDFFLLIKNKKDYLENTVQVIGLENLRDALGGGRGCILISGHFGNWELSGCALANLGFKLNVVVLEHADPRINNLFIEQRKKTKINIVPIGGARRAFQKALSRNEPIGILADRPFGDRGIEVKFFEKKVIVPRGAALLSLRNGSPIVILFSYKEDTKKNEYKLVLDRPFMPEKKDSVNETLKDITEKFMKRFEYYIRKYPSQWYMFNKVWED